MSFKDTKITWFMYFPYECTAVEEYLEQMAEKGWLLKSIKGAFFKFKKIEPQKIKYSVDVLNKVSVFDHKDSDVALEYREYCKTAGWNYVCQAGKVQIFYTKDDKETISIHTDEEEKFKSVFKASLNNVGMQLFLIFMLIFNLYILLFMGSADFALASNLAIASTVMMLSIIIISSIRVVSFCIWVIKAKGQLKVNKFMPYNNYKQLRRKNILVKAYTLIILLVLVRFFVFDKHNSISGNISLLIILCIPAVIMVCVQGFINKKRYSKKTNMIINVGSIIVSVYLVLMFIGSTVIWSITDMRHNKVPVEKVSLTLEDFGCKGNDKEIPYTKFDKSVLAKRINYIHGEGNNELFYTILQSQYPWVIKFHEKRLVSRLNKYGNDLKLLDTGLPKNIKVYSNNKKRSYVLVSDNKVADITKAFSNVSEEEFLNKIYEKLLK